MREGWFAVVKGMDVSVSTPCKRDADSVHGVMVERIVGMPFSLVSLRLRLIENRYDGDSLLFVRCLKMLRAASVRPRLRDGPTRASPIGKKSEASSGACFSLVDGILGTFKTETRRFRQL